MNKMKFSIQLPSRKESVIAISLMVSYLIFAALTMGLRPEHFGFMALFLVLFMTHSFTRKLLVCLLPFVLFGASYDVMRLYPNYMVNPIDITDLHDADAAWFGLSSEAGPMTLNEFFLQHTHPVADFLSGFFYLCWVPGPVAFGIYCFLTGRRALLVRFTWAFLFMNLIGFVGYYIHPASPPWFYAQCGGVFDPALCGQTMGSEAGLSRFDAVIGMPLFHDMYSRNANVFAAVPSLHSTYCLLAFLYALRGRCTMWVTLPLFIISVGICWTAVYTSHHYVIDVLLGVTLAIVFFLLWETVLLRLSLVRRFIANCEAYVS